MEQITFEEFPKIARLSRRCVVTEKLDGINAQVIITDDGQIGAASRTRLIMPEDDISGFAAWVQPNREELLKLGPGRHFGEWWGSGIGKRYGGQGNPVPKTFSLFNVSRWYDGNAPRFVKGCWNAGYAPVYLDDCWPGIQAAPHCCSVVPVLYVGDFDSQKIEGVIDELRANGSRAAPGCKAEGVIVYHEKARLYFKKTLENDEEGKSSAQVAGVTQ